MTCRPLRAVHPPIPSITISHFLDAVCRHRCLAIAMRTAMSAANYDVVAFDCVGFGVGRASRGELRSGFVHGCVRSEYTAKCAVNSDRQQKCAGEVGVAGGAAAVVGAGSIDGMAR